jgi:hypothetical protein
MHDDSVQKRRFGVRHGLTVASAWGSFPFRDEIPSSIPHFSHVDILHAGVVVATCAQRLRQDQADRVPRARASRRARDATAGLTVTRLANNTGVITPARTTHGG